MAGLCWSGGGPPLHRRVHGLQPPLHPQQLLGWLLLLLFAAASFLLLVPALSPSLWPVLFAVLASLFAVHLAAHLAAVLLDPADPELRNLLPSASVVPEFDRTKHAHVIENGRCHLCNITTSGPGTKHCSVCNTCVGRFDHHCKWLNHCIGGRNYVSFLVCVVSAVLACLLILGLCVAVLVLYHTDPTWLTVWYYSPFDGTVYEPHSFNMFAIDNKLFLCLTGVVGTLAAVAAGLLVHLCLFHAYISYLGITTYEYIRNYRGGTAARRPPDPPEPIFTVHEYRNGTKASPGSEESRYLCHGLLKRPDGRTPVAEPVKPAEKGNYGRIVTRPDGKTELVVRKTCPGCRYCRMLKADPTLKEQIDAYKRKSARRRQNGRERSWSVCGEAEVVRRGNQIRPSRSLPGSLSGSLPSLPPPARRQIQAVSLKELSEVLAAVQGPRVQKRPLPRRHQPGKHRKSNPLSPTLSPIHESGLSNPPTPRLRPVRQPAWVPPPPPAPISRRLSE